MMRLQLRFAELLFQIPCKGRHGVIIPFALQSFRFECIEMSYSGWHIRQQF